MREGADLVKTNAPTEKFTSTSKIKSPNKDLVKRPGNVRG